MAVKIEVFYIIYGAMWFILFPAIILYFVHRGRKDSTYLKNFGERFGLSKGSKGAVWIHAVSLGELRSAIPLIYKLLERGEKVLTTHITPAGRKEAERAFSREIENGTLSVCYLPFDMKWTFKRFLRAHKPKICLIMEQEIWPALIKSNYDHGVKTFLCNSQITQRSIKKAKLLSRIFGHPVSLVFGVMAKSKVHAQNFRDLGAKNVTVCGEIRFDQAAPENLLNKARDFKKALFSTPNERYVITIASADKGEENVYLSAFIEVKRQLLDQGKPAPFLIYVPRAPEEFANISTYAKDKGLKVLERSNELSSACEVINPEHFKGVDILIGDSMGEMPFYLEMCDLVISGGGFLPGGAHNITEALSLGKSVIVGPHIWTIEFPALEAIDGGVLNLVKTSNILIEEIISAFQLFENKISNEEKVKSFYNQFTGATNKIITEIYATR